jgi:hypothetical protein
MNTFEHLNSQILVCTGDADASEKRFYKDGLAWDFTGVTGGMSTANKNAMKLINDVREY